MTKHTFFRKCSLSLCMVLIFTFAGKSGIGTPSAYAAGKPLSNEEKKQIFVIFKKNDLAGMKQMLSSGVDVNTDMGGGVTLLMKAANIGTPDMVGFLLENGADINAVHSGGTNALMMSLSNSRHFQDIVPILLEAGADVRVTNNRNGYNPVWKALSKIRQGAPNEPGTRVLKLLLSKGADPNAAMISNDMRFSGMTPLMNVSGKGWKPVAELLLAYGADPQSVTGEGKKAIDFAKEKNHQDIVDLLSNWHPSQKEALKKTLSGKADVIKDGQDTIYLKCKDDVRAPWCYQETGYQTDML